MTENIKFQSTVVVNVDESKINDIGYKGIIKIELTPFFEVHSSKVVKDICTTFVNLLNGALTYKLPGNVHNLFFEVTLRNIHDSYRFYRFINSARPITGRVELEIDIKGRLKNNGDYTQTAQITEIIYDQDGNPIKKLKGQVSNGAWREYY